VSRRPRIRLQPCLRFVGITAATLLLVMIAAAAMLLGSETGTRWILGQVTRVVPGELVLSEYEGTLLRGLRIQRMSYSYAAIRVTAVDLFLEPDWLRSNTGRIALQQLSAEQISYRNIGSTDSSPKPLFIAMPALPIAIAAADLSTRSLQVGDRLISDLAAQGVRIHGNRIRADRVSGEMARVIASFSRLDTTLAGDVPMSAAITWRLAEGPWSGKGSVSGSLAELEFDHEVAGSHPAAEEGKLFLLGRIDPQVDATVRFESWQFGKVTATAGVLQVAGTAKSYRVELEVGVNDEQGRSVTLTGEVAGNTEGLRAIDVLASGAAGRATATGTLAWRPSFSTDLAIQAQGIDPAQFAAVKPGALDSELRLSARSVRDFSLRIDSLSGIYDKQPLRATGDLARNQDDWRCTACDLSFGPNRILVDGEMDPGSLSATVNVDAPELSLLWPPLSGALTADASLSGNASQPVFSGTASGSEIGWQDWALSSFSVSSRSSTRDRVDLDIDVDGLKRGDTAFGGGSARLSGTRDSIDSALQWKLGKVEAGAEGIIGLLEKGMVADLRSASLGEPDLGTWQLADPVRLTIDGDNIDIGPQQWENGDSRLNVPKFRLAGEQMDIEAALVALPLASLNGWLPENIRLSGQVDADLQLNRLEGQRSGSLRWNQRDTVLHIKPLRDEAIDIRAPVVSASFRLSGDATEGQVVLEVEPGIRASLELATDGLSSDSALRARFLFSGSEWEWISAIFPEIDNFKGMITADASAVGTVGAPALQGELRWQEGELAIPVLNLPLTDIEVRITGSSAGDASIAGSATAGRGKLTIDGSLADLLSDDRSFSVQLAGRKASLLNWPDYRLTASPDLVVNGNQAGIKVSGKVAVDQATISVRELPEGAVSPSADVTVTGRTETPKATVPLSGEVELQLGDNVHVRAFGLDTRLEGDLRFKASQKREPRAEGELELVDGVFSAYGQELRIEKGTLTFTGPLDDPIVNIRAIREINGPEGVVTAGLELRGRAQNVSSSVFSRPAMSEADALSYLVIGRPLEEATVADGSMLSGTAYALGLTQAAVITNQVGQNLGLDQLSVAGSNQSTTSLVAGKQVNSRLYVRYAYGVFTEIGNLLLRYRLSERLTVEAGSGESQSMDLLYTVEKP
jgi:translocation and assembly module TamB